MSSIIDPVPDTGIHRAELIWSWSERRSQAQQHEHCLMELLDLSRTGLIVDCSQVENGNRQLIGLLMRVRQYARKGGKHLALYHVTRDLRNLIALCNLRLALPAFKNAAAAEKLIRKLANCQPRVIAQSADLPFDPSAASR